MRRYLILGGIAGPALFATLTIVCGSLRPDYNHVTQFISELGETGGEFATLMNYVGFMSSAALILLFAMAIVPGFTQTALTKIGALLVAIYAVSMFAAGVFSCDTGCAPTQPSNAQVLHDIVSIIAFPALIAAALVWGFGFLRMPEWRRFGVYSLGTATISTVLLIAMVNTEETRAGTGLLQRIFLGVLFLWLALMAWRFWRESDDAQPATFPVSCP